MRKTFAPVLMAALALWGCSKAEHDGDGTAPGNAGAESTVAYGFT